MNYEIGMYAEENIELNYIKFENLAKNMIVDNSKINFLIENKEQIKCPNFNKPLFIKKRVNLFKYFNCGNLGKLSDLDSSIIANDYKNLEKYEEIYNELKNNKQITKKDMALFAIRYYKIDSTFIDNKLFKDHDIMYELIVNHLFNYCGDKYYSYVYELLKDDKFLKSLLEALSSEKEDILDMFEFLKKEYSDSV